MKPPRLSRAPALILFAALVLSCSAPAAIILPPLYRGGVNVGTNGCRVSQGITFWKNTIYAGAEAETCYTGRPESSATVYAVDVRDPANPQFLARSSFGGCKAYGLAVFEDKLYVANWSEILRTFDVCARTQIDPLGILAVPGDFGWTLSVQNDRVYLSEAHELARSFYIINVANPAAPSIVSATDWAGSPAVEGPYSFYADGTWFKVLNISDESAPLPVAGLDLGVNLSDPQLQGHLAFASWNFGPYESGTSGIVCVDISDPLAPRQVGRWSTPDFYYFGNLTLLGDLAFLPTGGNGIFAINIANPAAMFSVAQFEVPYYALELSLTANGRHVYSGTVEENRTGGIHCWQVFTQDPDDAPPGNWRNFSPRQTSWDLQYRGDTLPPEADPPWALHEGSQVWASIAGGVLRINDTGTASGDKVKWACRWNATSSRGATVMLRARCASYQDAGAFIPNLVIEDGKHLEEFAFLSDKLRARHAALEYPVDGTQWHTYRITTWSNQFKVYLDELPTPVLSGTLSQPSHYSRLIFGSGSSPARQDLEIDFLHAFSGGARLPDDLTHDTTPDLRVDVSDLPGRNSVSGLVTNTARVHWSTDAGLTWQSSGGVQWNGQYEADLLPSASAPAWHPVEGSETLALVTNGLLRLLDTSTASNTKLKYQRLWKASPATGATLFARARCAAAGGDTTYTGNLFVEDGLHVLSLKILPDRIVAREPGLTFMLDGTQFHTYRIATRTNFFRVFVDDNPTPALSGLLTADTTDNRVMFGTGASAGTQEIYFDYVRYCATADLAPGQEGPGGPVTVAVATPSCAERGVDRCTLTARAVPFNRFSETANLLRFSIQDIEGNLGWSPVYTIRILILDTDSDGMDDNWERSFFGSLAQDGSTDFDHDRASDADEFRAGTNPLDPASVLRIVTARALNPYTFELLWNSVPGKTYEVQSRGPTGSVWTKVPSNIVTATANQTRWVGLHSPLVRQFYRVEVDF